MVRLIMLIGLPGSGKSTLAQQLLLGDNSLKLQLISTDAIRAQLFGDESIQGSWVLIWNQVKRQFLQAVEQILLKHASQAIYDATNASRKQRREVITLARECGFTQITGLWVDTPVQVCLERNQRRSRQVPEDVIWHMYRQYDVPPALSEGMDRLIRFNTNVYPAIIIDTGFRKYGNCDRTYEQEPHL
ncbi:MAG: AAA family ATPase [Crinalium sp.]